MAPREKSDDDMKRKKNFFKKRFPGFKKKATELSVLCGNSVGFICYGPDNDDLHVWPEPEENPQALPQIVAKFNGLSDQKRKNHACDLSDFLMTQSETKKTNAAFESSPVDLEGLSVDELTSHLSNLESLLVGIGQERIRILKKTIKDSSSEQRGIVWEDRPRVSKKATTSDQKDMVSEDHLRVSDRKQLGFGVFDELGYVVSGSTSVSDFECKTLGVPKDDYSLAMEADYSRLDPITLGVSGAIPVTYDLGVSCDDRVWDLEFSDSFIANNTCKTPITDNWGHLQPLTWEPFL